MADPATIALAVKAAVAAATDKRTWKAVGVLIAAYLVKSLPLDILRWLVDAVIVYTAIMMFRSASKNKATAA